MFRPVIVLRRVLVFRRIATPDVAALEAQPQMHPAVADGQALLASIGRVGFALKLLRRDGAEMRAVVHRRIVMPK